MQAPVAGSVIWMVPSCAGGGRGVLTARGTRRKPIPGGSVAASMPPHGPAIGEATAPESWLVTSLKNEDTAADS
ncbi:hypothetical protein XarbCFBP7408_18570 [Xanthomonas arboricola pv. guizotiae]|uniref:Uncharacterized protein n=1 Tax=Xanthomonas arboricola pv. guizotiae TaxID=487867 RepID=A0A2S6ZTZ4_9XANT|nr:hypothetical protein XarbCFBP7409_17020 [Xanthomonas arboricola pv. guizotiae]PPU20034.1 hypothetical protein XarbCFBP7408_18570 [Xanthomonas arboricola pv. guizotiae]